MSATIIQFPAQPPRPKSPTMFRVEMAGDTGPGRLVATVAEVAALIAGNQDWRRVVQVELLYDGSYETGQERQSHRRARR